MSLTVDRISLVNHSTRDGLHSENYITVDFTVDTSPVGGGLLEGLPVGTYTGHNISLKNITWMDSVNVTLNLDGTTTVYPLGTPVETIDPLVWAAAGSEYMFTGAGSHELEAEHIGVGDAPTFTNSALLLPDHEGVYVDIEANSPTWHGARQAENVA